MLGAVLLGTLALAGSSGPLWWSDAAPHAGQPYIGLSYTGAGNFGCGAAVGSQPVRTTIYRFDATTVCVFHVPSGSAGKLLRIGFEVESSDGHLITIASGAVRPKLIRR